MPLNLKKRFRGWAETQRAKMREQAKINAEFKAIEKKAEVETYRREKIKQARTRGAKRGKQRAKGLMANLVGDVGSSEGFNLDAFGLSSKKKRSHQRKRR